MDSSPLFFATSGPTKRRKHFFVCYFLNIAFVIFSILSQIQNGTSLRKKNLGLPRLEPHRKINAYTLYKFPKTQKNSTKNRPTRFQTLTFWSNLGFPKSWICSWIFQGFPTPWISHPMDFGFSGKAAGAADKNPLAERGVLRVLGVNGIQR